MISIAGANLRRKGGRNPRQRGWLKHLYASAQDSRHAVSHE
jgi:hypothetical protein